ncbi:hypothetical protein ID866_10630 [Astraeus odoratus]|nr:hypothetical protein ID866_10630 [Astraeus odoratus]
MSSPCCTLSPHERCLAKTKAPKERTEEEWKLVSEGELDPMSSDDKKTAEMRDQEKKWRVEVWKEEHRRRQDEAEKRAQEEAEHLVREEATRKAEEECKAQEEAARAREEAKRLAKEAVEREEAVKRAAEAVEERADTKRRAVEEHLWEAVGQWSEMAVAPPRVAKPSGRMMVAGPSASGCRASGVQDPCTWCRNKGTLCILGAAKGKTTACKVCHHAKVSCSWTKKMVGELRKWKWMRRSEEAEEAEVIDVDEDEDEEQPHFVVPQHLVEEHQDTLGALMMTLDTLSMDFLEFWRDLWNLGVAMLRAIETIANELQRANNLKEEEMGRSKGKGKERAQEEFRRARMEDDNGDTEMGGAGPSSLV